MKLPFKPFQPDIGNLLRVLKREKTTRPVLFEFMVNRNICQMAAGFDHQPEICSFVKGERDALESISLNQGAMITDRESSEKYRWNDPRH